MQNQQIFPTKGNLIASKKSLLLANLGYDLMDRKHNILVREMMGLIDQSKIIRESIDDIYSQAYAALKKANITLGICDSLAESVPIDDGLSLSLRSVMGVELPTIHLKEQDLKPCYDFSSTNSSFDEAFVSFQKVKLIIVQLAEIENSVYRLAMAIKKTHSRANALKNVIIPNLEHAIKFITSALEEKEREEFSRLKVIKSSKEKAIANDL